MNNFEKNYEILDEGLKELLLAGALGASALGNTDAGVPKDNTAIVKEAGVSVDLDKIWALESSRGKNKNMTKPNSSGALGHFQFLKNTWEDLVSKMGVEWDWASGAVDYEKSKKVADYYLNNNIPKMLRGLKVPDSVEARLASYNWGVGNVRKMYKKYGNDWVNHLPDETENYIIKYKGI